MTLSNTPGNTPLMLSCQWQLPHIDIDHISDQEILLDILPAVFMEQYHVLILSGNRIIIHDPAAREIIQEIYFYLGRAGDLYLADRDKLGKRIAKLLYLKESENLFDNNDAPITVYIEKLCREAVSKKASDIHLETNADYLLIRLRIDGILYEIAKLAKSFSARMITHLKVLAQLDITEKRLPQDGRLRLCFQENKQYIDCRISTCPALYEEKIVLRVLNINTQPLDINYLGLSLPQKKLFKSLLEKPQGMILVTGPTGSGKTVTLYTALNILNHYHANILSVEDPVEIELTGITQVQVNNKIDLTFSKVLRAFLRQDPDIIMVGEMRDKETADIAVKAAQTGHLVLSTLHTNSAAETLSRLINMGIPAYDIAASVSLIIAQRLVRCLCKFCKIPEKLPDQLKNKYEQSYKAGSCVKCQNGYQGRTGIYEFLAVTPLISTYILKNAAAKIIEKKACETQGMKTLYENGLEKVRSGITSLSELSRVIRT